MAFRISDIGPIEDLAGGCMAPWQPRVGGSCHLVGLGAEPHNQSSLLSLSKPKTRAAKYHLCSYVLRHRIVGLQGLRTVTRGGVEIAIIDVKFKLKVRAQPYLGICL